MSSNMLRIITLGLGGILQAWSEACSLGCCDAQCKCFTGWLVDLMCGVSAQPRWSVQATQGIQHLFKMFGHSYVDDLAATRPAKTY